MLGRRGVDLKPSQLTDYVWGVTMLADWSIRAPRETSGGPLNFAFPKNFDTSCSLGPCLAVGEADPTNVDMETLVNGERRQSFKTLDMVFSFGEYLEYLSRDFTLYPGDIISGGTAAGTAADSSDLLADGSSAPERFLKPGDLVEMNSPPIGPLRPRGDEKRRRPAAGGEGRSPSPPAAAAIAPASSRAAPARAREWWRAPLRGRACRWRPPAS